MGDCPHRAISLFLTKQAARHRCRNGRCKVFPGRRVTKKPLCRARKGRCGKEAYDETNVRKISSTHINQMYTNNQRECLPCYNKAGNSKSLVPFDPLMRMRRLRGLKPFVIAVLTDSTSGNQCMPSANGRNSSPTSHTASA